MTGFGRGQSQNEGRTFLVEIKTVNHRYSDIFVKMPRHLSFMEDKIRDLAGKSLSRGKIDLFISYEDTSELAKKVVFDEGLAKAYLEAAKIMRDKFEVKDDITVSLLTKFPDILKVEKSEEDEQKLWLLLKEALENALMALVKMRESEGERLKYDLLEKCNFIENSLKDIIKRAPEVVKEYKIKLENRIKELLDQQTIDENRLATEIAFFADRCSIDEEIVRLGCHITQMREILKNSQPVGRKLDFLIQEMNREINTIGSKANDLQITRTVVEVKSEIEKLREQIQNVE
jgi:uncharacterized protein (TIGR00255 family)